MANIYEIASDWFRVQDMMEDPELDPQTLADTLEAIEGELEVKAENYAKVMKNLEGDIAAIKEYEGNLAECNGSDRQDQV